MYGRNSTILTSIINKTAVSMSQSLYQNTIATTSLMGVNKGYNTIQNTQYARGISKPISCGRSKCGSIDRPIDEYCKLH